VQSLPTAHGDSNCTVSSSHDTPSGSVALRYAVTSAILVSSNILYIVYLLYLISSRLVSRYLHRYRRQSTTLTHSESDEDTVPMFIYRLFVDEDTDEDVEVDWSLT